MNHTAAVYTPLYPDIFKKSSINGIESEIVQTEIEPAILCIKKVDLLFCQQLKEECEHWRHWHLNQNRDHQLANSMHNTGYALDGEIFAPVIKRLLAELIQPVAGKHFADYFGAQLDCWHAFIVSYNPSEQYNLGMHVDASHVTFNLCLENNASGGNLLFYGERCTHHMNEVGTAGAIYAYTHQAGDTILHSGLNRHRVSTVMAGERTNLIIWCRNNNYSWMHDSEAAEKRCALCNSTS